MLYLGGVLGLQRLILYPRYATISRPELVRSVDGLERLPLLTDAGVVEAYFIPGRGVSKDKPGPAVIFAHGNAELIEYWPEALAPYREMGVSLLLPEYRGYGRSAGSPSEKAITSDFVRFYDHLRERPDVDEGRIVFHGRSLGGGAVCALSRQRKPAAMILQSTFINIASLAKRYLLPRALVLDPFENEQAVGELDVPMLVVHGNRDRLIPFSHAERLVEAAQNARLVTYPADHNDCPPDYDRYFRDIRRFLGEAAILTDE